MFALCRRGGGGGGSGPPRRGGVNLFHPVHPWSCGPYSRSRGGRFADRTADGRACVRGCWTVRAGESEVGGKKRREEGKKARCSMCKKIFADLKCRVIIILIMKTRVARGGKKNPCAVELEDELSHYRLGIGCEDPDRQTASLPLPSDSLGCESHFHLNFYHRFSVCSICRSAHPSSAIAVRPQTI